jgi:hypothetical protein
LIPLSGPPYLNIVMAGLGRPKDGTLRFAYVPAISIHGARACHLKRHHRVTALRAGPVMME